MVSGTEKWPKNREAGEEKPESLIFNDKEGANEFVERVEKRKVKEKRHGVRRDRELLADELAREIEKQGEEVIDTSRPWEHSPEEHREVQGLVEMAFREDLVLALRKMRKSANYPRIVDLFHDVLTDQMYEVLAREGLNRQKVGKGLWVMLGLVSLIIVAALLLFVWV
jgi:hypothetical protein